MADTIPKLETELAAIKARIQKRYKQNCDDQERSSEIQEKLRRLRLAELIGIENGVMTRHRVCSGQCMKLNDARGTLIKVNRTRCVVHFGKHGEWRIPFGNLLPATEASKQGYIMEFSAP